MASPDPAPGPDGDARLVKGAMALALILILAATTWLVAPAALNPEWIQGWLGRAGPLAPILFIALMATAVVVSPIPSLPLDLAAGATFGPWLGALWAVAGGLLGALVSFGIARWLGREVIARFLGGHIQFCTHCSDRLLTRVVLLSRLLPIVSFDLVSYAAGLTRMSASRFALATGLGMIPLTLLYTHSGHALSFGPRVTIPLGIVFVGLFFLLPRWIERHDLFSMRRHFEHEPGPAEH
jgi:uncharacterized membrane protein YdjX (TVP38/TMEM64 family)